MKSKLCCFNCYNMDGKPEIRCKRLSAINKGFVRCKNKDLLFGGKTEECDVYQEFVDYIKKLEKKGD